MKIGVPKESWSGEERVALVPATVKKLAAAGFTVVVEAGAGEAAGFSDGDYEEAGAELKKQRATVLKNADIVVRVRKPKDNEVEKLQEKSVHISFLDPFNEKDLIGALKKRNITAISMEMIPVSYTHLTLPTSREV